ncbi:MAG TPA: acyltransferase [Fimbriimonadales bacterium]|nr:acyltransferase [Fimbriimonadales bacterium]
MSIALTKASASVEEAHAAVSVERNVAFDIFKGLAILEVILHHTLGFSASEFAIKGTAQWWTYFILQRIFHFAVPAFLLLSALLMTKSLLEKGQTDWKHFYTRKAKTILYPYILWTFLYITMRSFTPDFQMELTSVQFAFLTFPFPTLLSNASDVVRIFLAGKAFYHLYFLAILLQLILIFPVLFYCVRKTSWKLGHWLMLALSLQVGIYAILWFFRNWIWQWFPYPASTVFWYIPPILLGLYLGMHWQRWREIWQKSRVPFGIFATAALSLYLFCEWLFVMKGSVNSRVLNCAFIVYCTSISFLLLGLSNSLSKNGRLRSFLSKVGEKSLGLYLIHPAVLAILKRSSISDALSILPFSFFITFFLTLGGTWIIVEGIYRLKFNKLLFG